ncbi:terpenoid cyclases/protein prenyltransferase alpha-alpha toroid [Microdochium trichocladiopsis]|uniref:Terpenoid cyclases/protein prenyltransferase alpha-alpha toroid n=1 Tax=Microdochium trichocladiopsis TaxID=1682393 RepID=A0A9P9BNB1_9PEZI|nr:terpenoid cyclases/protein prenyltransferase alpha-alpha toroid [Microdochium trichocladiopsis]KAH7027548.1 terpenoid cyclases/protein prenyltransferase alpha-alpha toroid [Microdochium trichocladiopsis]
MDPSETAAGPPLDTARHIRYFQRCYKSLLPHHYTSMDSIRLTLGFFIVAALDLLSSASSYSEPPPDPRASSLIPAADRKRLREFVLSLQHPLGGFCGSPNHVLPREWSVEWDPAAQREVAGDPANPNIAATSFALLLLGLLAEGDGSDAYDGVHREQTLAWLKRLQRPDGSFGDVVNEHGFVSGGRDMRFCLLAATVRYILGGDKASQADDIDVAALVAHIRRGQTFDGGISESATHESHAGYAYCAVAALSILDLDNEAGSHLAGGITSIPSLIHFLVNRQFTYFASEGAGGSDEEGDDDEDEDTADASDILADLDTLSLIDPAATPAGFNGRINKKPDTCYTWWASGTLSILGEGALVDRTPSRSFLLEKTQHVIGGFGKHPGNPPDVYHAYLGLAALSTLAGSHNVSEDGLGKLDPQFCLGVEAVERIKNGRGGLLARARDDGKVVASSERAGGSIRGHAYREGSDMAASADEVRERLAKAMGTKIEA